MSRRVVFIVALLAVVLLSGSTAFWLANRNGSLPTKTVIAPVFKRSNADKNSDAADKLATKGDYNGAIQLLETYIKGTKDSQELFVYYSHQATLFFNHNDLVNGLIVAQKAYNLNATSDSAAFVGQIALAKGDKALALMYYQKALELTKTSQDPLAKTDGDYYSSIIASIKAGQ